MRQKTTSLVTVEIRWRYDEPEKPGEMYVGPRTAADCIDLFGRGYHFGDRQMRKKILADFAAKFGALCRQQGARATDADLIALLDGRVEVQESESGEVIRFEMPAA